MGRKEKGAAKQHQKDGALNVVVITTKRIAQTKVIFEDREKFLGIDRQTKEVQ